MNRKPDIFMRLCLVAILVLLALIATKQFWPGASAQADSPQAYKTEIIDDGPKGATEVGQVIQGRSRQGWELVSTSVYFYSYPNSAGPLYLLVFRKPQ